MVEKRMRELAKRLSVVNDEVLRDWERGFRREFLATLRAGREPSSTQVDKAEEIMELVIARSESASRSSLVSTAAEEASRQARESKRKRELYASARTQALALFESWPAEQQNAALRDAWERECAHRKVLQHAPKEQKRASALWWVLADLMEEIAPGLNEQLGT